MDIKIIEEKNRFGDTRYLIVPECVVDDIMYIKDVVQQRIANRSCTISELSIDERSCNMRLIDNHAYNMMEEMFTNKKLLYLHNFGTEREYRRQGYGRHLLKEVLRKYSDCVIFLHVSSSGEMNNEQLIQFYEQEGFKKLCEDEEFQIMYIEL